MRIFHLSHDHINKALWNQTLSESFNGTIYAWSWYLDAVCPDWEALVTSGYEHIMPLTGRQKFGISYLYRPLLSQQLGIFSSKILKEEETIAFIKAIPSKYKLIEITLNKLNQISDKSIHQNKHISCELDLIPSYENIRSKYHSNTLRNIKKASKKELMVQTSLSIEQFLDLLHADRSQGSSIVLNKKNATQFLKLIENLEHHDAMKIWGISKKNGELLAATLFGHSHHTWYYLVPAQTEESKKLRSQFLLVDSFIRAHAQKDKTLDFEGSDIEGIARFYRGFGAIDSIYPGLRINNLPAWINRIRQVFH